MGSSNWIKTLEAVAFNNLDNTAVLVSAVISKNKLTNIRINDGPIHAEIRALETIKNENTRKCTQVQKEILFNSNPGIKKRRTFDV